MNCTTITLDFSKIWILEQLRKKSVINNKIIRKNNLHIYGNQKDGTDDPICRAAKETQT